MQRKRQNEIRRYTSISIGLYGLYYTLFVTVQLQGMSLLLQIIRTLLALSTSIVTGHNTYDLLKSNNILDFDLMQRWARSCPPATTTTSYSAN